MKNIESLDIRPNVNIYTLFTRLNYKPHYAIAEFVDNSTASFFEKEKILKFYGIKEVNIYINYDQDLDELTIEDDAYGMGLEDFKRAILLGAKPENVDGRNEFGMGLKTAASWFGNIWSVTSTEFNNNKQYFAEVDIPYMDKNNLETVDIIETEVSPKKHGTIIKISQLTKSLKSRKTRNKIVGLLSSMYRRDINKGNIKIYFNDERLTFDSYPVLDYKGERWEKQVDFKFDYENKEYHVTGKVGILNPGGFPKAGFALFRRHRVIIGGEGENYKPQDIFGQAQSQVSLKLFGELNMDSFPVNQAKDGFVWDGGLEEEFLKQLEKNINEYIKIAKLSRTARMEEEGLSDETSDSVEKDVKESLIKYRERLEKEPIELRETYDEISKYIKAVEEENEELAARKYKEESKTRTYPAIKLTQNVSKAFTAKWVEDSNDANWLTVNDNENNIELTININHDFFKPFSNNQDFKVVLEKLALAFVIAEKQAQMLSPKDNKLIYASQIRLLMNETLKNLK